MFLVKKTRYFGIRSNWLFLAFCSCIAVGTREGYMLYNVDPFGRFYNSRTSFT